MSLFGSICFTAFGIDGTEFEWMHALIPESRASTSRFTHSLIAFLVLLGWTLPYVIFLYMYLYFFSDVDACVLYLARKAYARANRFFSLHRFPSASLDHHRQIHAF
jgi:hypothetical protein